MKVQKILAPLEKAALSLFKNHVGNDLGKQNSYLTKGLNPDIFIKEQKVKTVRSVDRRKW